MLTNLKLKFVAAFIVFLLFFSLLFPGEAEAFKKGVSYYVENWCNQKYDPLPPGRTPAQFVPGTRYFDLTETELNFITDLGLDFVTLEFGAAGWYNIAAQNPYQNGHQATEWNNPYYNFRKLDEWISKLQEKDVEVVLLIWGTPLWASGATVDCSKDPTFSPQNKPPKNLQEFGKFMEAVATRYDGKHVVNTQNPNKFLKVTKFGFWIEPNLNDFWEAPSLAAAATSFMAMNNFAYDQVKKVQPNAEIWSPSTTQGWNARTSPVEFIKNTNNGLKFDIYAHHGLPLDFNKSPYDEGLAQTAHNNGYLTISNLGDIAKTLDQYSNYKGKKIVLTEIGYRSNWEKNFDNEVHVSPVTVGERTKAHYLAQAFELARKEPRIIGVGNNTLYTPWTWWSIGVVQYKDNEKLPAYDVLKGQTSSVIPDDFYHLLLNFAPQTFYDSFRFAKLRNRYEHPLPAPTPVPPLPAVLQTRVQGGKASLRYVPTDNNGNPDYNYADSWLIYNEPNNYTAISDAYLPGAKELFQTRMEGTTVKIRYVPIGADGKPKFSDPTIVWNTYTNQPNLTAMSDTWLPSNELLQTQMIGTTAKMRYVPIGANGRPQFPASEQGWETYPNLPKYDAIADTYLPTVNKLLQTRMIGSTTQIRYVPIGANGRPNFNAAEGWQNYTTQDYDTISDVYLPLR